MRSRSLKRWLARQFHKKVGRAPSAQALQDSLCVIEGKALFDGAEYPTAVRIAGDDINIYVDLCNPEWEAVHVDRDGWRVVPGHTVPVKFVRRSGMESLPTPVPGGTVDLLREHVNLPEGEADSSWALVLTQMMITSRSKSLP